MVKAKQYFNDFMDAKAFVESLDLDPEVSLVRVHNQFDYFDCIDHMVVQVLDGSGRWALIAKQSVEG